MLKGQGKASKDAQILEDPIGQLPEDVLCVVFSHLTMKEAGRTSILSHRWKNMWTLNPYFCFDGSERKKRMLDSLRRLPYGEEREEMRKHLIEVERMEYIRWVNYAVDNHRGSDLEQLMVVFCLDARHSLHLDNWISSALRKKVKTIKIDLHPCKYEFTDRRSYSFLRSAHVTSGIECLTSLILKNVHITGEAVEDLLLVCPLLENLNLDSSKDLLNLRVVGSSLKLKYLSIMRCYHLRNLEIYAPKLVSFNYDRRKFVGGSTLQVEGLYCLVDLYIHNTSLRLPDLVQFSNYFSQLETLKLDFSYESFQEPLGLSQLTNLKHLTFKIMSPNGFYLRGLAEFINLCPLLQKFTLGLRNGAQARLFMSWDYLFPHQHLKVVEMIGFGGRYHEIAIANFFLESVTCLEKLILNTSYELLVTDENEVSTGNHENEIAKFFLKSVTCLEKLILNTSYELLATDENEVRLSTGNVAWGLREIPEELRREARHRVELLIV